MRTITSAREIDALFKRGRRASDALLMLLVKPADEAGGEGRVLFVAGKKLGGAVVRNRDKRVLREVCRRAGGPWAGHDVALIARKGTSTATPAQLDEQLERLLSKAGVRP